MFSWGGLTPMYFGDLIFFFHFKAGFPTSTPPKSNSEFTPEKWWLEDDPFLLGFCNFSGVNSLLNFGRVFSDRLWPLFGRLEQMPHKEPNRKNGFQATFFGAVWCCLDRVWNFFRIPSGSKDVKSLSSRSLNHMECFCKNLGGPYNPVKTLTFQSTIFNQSFFLSTQAGEAFPIREPFP